ncbi:hypothetical protein [Clostridium botulinum]|uniref:hypothetical protein n=1 Tax=Clostridium botulinum TaxID=1491 RepID=UPI0009B4D547|nr:hypothetical protein [Clostridium botulinum]MBN3398133.1 hypothetical protein [Clostridium botulinum]MBN3413173.1 hypothetical protein [Clostridium botulinum]
MGRKRKPVDWKLYEKLKERGLSDLQIAIRMKMSQSQLKIQKKIRREGGVPYDLRNSL